MTLWNIIRDFFVQYIFGGVTSNGSIYGNLIGDINAVGNGVEDFILSGDTSVPFVNIGQGVFGDIFDQGNLGANIGDVSLYIGLGDWLSTTATIITLCAICVFLFLFVRWLFRLTAGLFQARG